LRSFLI
jgi:hypothetical protein